MVSMQLLKSAAIRNLSLLSAALKTLDGMPQYRGGIYVSIWDQFEILGQLLLTSVALNFGNLNLESEFGTFLLKWEVTKLERSKGIFSV